MSDLRKFLKATFIDLDDIKTDQMKGIEIPPIQKEVSGEITALPEVDINNIKNPDIFDCIKNRRSRRGFTDKAISLHGLSFLLWSTQGVARKLQDDKMTIRTVPSGGSRHPFETYLAVHRVDSLKPGIYRYLPMQHSLTFLFEDIDIQNKLIDGSLGQKFVGNCAVTFIWSAIPYRTEWRYSIASAKIILQDSGHLCQNLYLACEALGLGTCAIGAYDQKKIDELLHLDGEDEFTVYLAPVGVC
ncbi:MAG: SagB/ThcOx family dehydrogenase [Candidatus Cloacimonetes bacterium]|nr:SagB/ThcOx family dehydrogenase [Candidatus Cloacimonadota bacterium]